MTEHNPVVLVHGYRYDTTRPGKNNPYETDFRYWRQELEWVGDFEVNKVKEFGWYSAGGWRALFMAWSHGYLNTYRWAYSKLSMDAGRRLAAMSKKYDKLDVVCHSLGSRVVLEAIRLGGNFGTVIILSGAEMVDVARPIVEDHPGIKFWNVLSRSDLAIDYLAEKFTPGKGILHDRPAIGNDGIVGLFNCRNVVLDDLNTKQVAMTMGWDLIGDDPNSSIDHRISHEHHGNWKMYRTMLWRPTMMNGIPDALD